MSLTLPAPIVTRGAGEPVPVMGPVRRIEAILRHRGLDPGKAALTHDRPASTEAYQQQVFREAWRNSLRLSGHADYVRYTLDKLETGQRPEHLQKFVDQLAAARRHNRDQALLPPEERNERRANVRHVIVAGTVGAGKTVAAAAAGSYAGECGLMARFLSHSMYLSWLRPNSAPAGLTATQVRERYERCDLLILDDLCNEMDDYASHHVRTHTSDLITARINSGRATLFTTNLNFDQVAEVLGERLASRIGARATVLRMTGGDRRKPEKW
ncbi:ATP-binding protein [Streptomyces sp. NPDC097619]|uniref:ATP-binding protein n=1 Tax=Streptomyces sp. NPDC097619 TaxID=3157228 RepID=UPI0033190E44